MSQYRTGLYCDITTLPARY